MSPCPLPDEWPVDGLLRARAEVETWARERGILPDDHHITIEVRGIRNRDTDTVFGRPPRDRAVTVHYGENGWTE